MGESPGKRIFLNKSLESPGTAVIAWIRNCKTVAILNPMSTLILVRTACCETYKCTGMRCSICPNRPENRQAADQCKRELAHTSLGARKKPQPSGVVRS